MKKTILIFWFGLLLGTHAFADTKCFLAKENNKVIVQEGDCIARHSPCSSFKIAISLMGYNEGILTDEIQPVLPFKKGYVNYMRSWKQPHNPTLWIKNSCVWYSQAITSKIGMEKFKEYLKNFDYGNQDVTGDKGKNNGLTHSWLASSLGISPQEQVIFLQNLIDGKLSVSDKAYEMTKKIIFVGELVNGWKLYGRSGFCPVLNQAKTQKLSNRYNEWFVGWVEKGSRAIVFASYIEHTDKNYNPASREAKTKAKKKLIQIVKRT